jgi:hypothetical protein
MPKDPLERIQELAAGYRRLSDEQFLEELSRLPTLPADTRDAWSRDENWELAFRHVAFGEVAAERRLRAAIVPLLVKASVDDPGETMRGLRHALEAIVDPDWRFLADAYVTAAALPQPGARRWSIFGLGVLRVPETMPVLVAALRDGETQVREAACQSICMLCQGRPGLHVEAVRVLEQYISDRNIGLAAKDAVTAILKEG